MKQVVPVRYGFFYQQNAKNEGTVLSKTTYKYLADIHIRRKHANARICKYSNTHIRTYARAHTHTHACTHTRTHTRAHTHARTHTHTHKHTNKDKECGRYVSWAAICICIANTQIRKYSNMQYVHTYKRSTPPHTHTHTARTTQILSWYIHVHQKMCNMYYICAISQIHVLHMGNRKRVTCILYV